MPTVLIHGPIVPSTVALIQKLLSSPYKELSVVYSDTSESVLPIKDKRLKVIHSPDPGEGYDDNNKNVNRMIVKITAGLNAIDPNETVFRLRSDLSLKEDIGYYFALYNKLLNTFSVNDDEFRIFSQRVLIGNWYTVNVADQLKLPYHPSDWMSLGKCSDLLYLYDAPFVPNAPKILRGEQHFYVNALKKKFDIPKIDYDVDVTDDNIYVTLKSFYNNFIVMNYSDLKIESTKYKFPCAVHPSYINDEEWQYLYSIFGT